jgi:8-hydroxy-5-deazaflavin:NADPH oxidoreductase
MRIAILGAGRVGVSLGDALKAKGHVVVYGVRDPGASAGFATKTVGGAISSADAVILATPWTVAEALICEHAPALTGKIVIDATNPLTPGATRLALGFDTSGVEVLQSHARNATFFKAFNVTGPGALSRPRYPQGLASAFVAGPRGEQKDVVMGLVRDVGLEAVDAGELRAARLLEPLGMLLMNLEDTGAKDRDLAFVLGARDKRQAEPFAVLDMETREAG